MPDRFARYATKIERTLWIDLFLDVGTFRLYGRTTSPLLVLFVSTVTLASGRFHVWLLDFVGHILVPTTQCLLG